MSKPTPGPWKVRIDPQDGRADMVTDDKAGVAALFFGTRTTEEVNANARLIAAAPDLLEGLSWAMDMLDMYDERLAEIDGREIVYSRTHMAGKAKARAAIAEAEGGA